MELPFVHCELGFVDKRRMPFGLRNATVAPQHAVIEFVHQKHQNMLYGLPYYDHATAANPL